LEEDEMRLESCWRIEPKISPDEEEGEPQSFTNHLNTLLTTFWREEGDVESVRRVGEERRG